MVSQLKKYGIHKRVFQREASGVLVAKYLSSLTQVELSKQGRIDMMMNFGDVSGVKAIADKYISHLTLKQVWQKNNLLFISFFMRRPVDKYFNLFFKDGLKLDKVVKQKNYAKSVVDVVIWWTFVKPKLDLTNDAQLEPDFEALYKDILMKFGIDCANRNILNSKVSFYNYRAHKYNLDWDKYLNYAIQQTQMQGVDTVEILMNQTI